MIGTATYKSKDYKLIYEDDQGLVWLDYTNPGSRRPYQMSWVRGLNEPGVLTYKFNQGIRITWQGDWRLPAAVDGAREFGYDGTTTAGFNITSSEMGHLYHKSLGNLGYYDTDGNPRPGWGRPESEHGWGLKNTGPFDNLDPGGRYWGGTEYSPYTQHSWDFNMFWGSQDNLPFKSSVKFYGLAVRSATVAGR